MRKTLLPVLVLLLGPSASLASGFEVINTNPRDLGMSASLVAAQQDAAATYQNPAALSKLEGLNLSLAGSVLSLRTEWTGTSALSGRETTEFAPTTPVALFVAYGTKVADRGLGVGFGMGTPGGGQMHWADDWEGSGRIITVERRMLGFYLNGGFEVLPGLLRVGGGAVYYYGIQYLKQGIQPFAGSYAELSTRGGGFAYQLSAEVTPLENLTLGIDYKHKGTMAMEGDGNFVVPPGAESPLTQDTGVEQDLPFPNTLAVGAAYRIAKPWLVTLQYNYSRFRVYEQDLFVPDAPGQQPIVVPRDYRDGHIIRGGVEWETTPQWTLRAGAMRDFSGYRSTTLSPTLPDSNTTGVSVGASYKLRETLGLHGAFFFGDRDRTRAAGDEAFPGSYKTNVWILALGVTWRTALGGGAE